MSWGSFFNEFFGPSVDEKDRCIEPLTDVRETDDEVVISVDLPFVVSKEDIEVYVTEDSIEITARTKRKIRWSRWGAHHRYVEFNHYRKRIELPILVDPNEVRATFRSGILEVRLRKKKKRVQIKIE